MPAEPDKTLIARILDYNQAKRALWDAYPDGADDAYDTDDPKHPQYHSTHADIWDAREGK